MKTNLSFIKRKMKLNLTISLVLMTASLLAQLPSYVPTSSLVAWYSFNGNANDLSGNNNNGNVMNGAALTSDRNSTPNAAYSFDGINDYIVVNGSPTFINDSLTLSFWINSTISFPNDLIELGNNSSVIWGATASTNWVEMAVGRGCGGGGTSYTQTAICSQGTWHHFVLVLSKNTHKLYKNGVYVGTCNKSQMSTLSCSSQSLYIGSAIFTSQTFFNGKLDDFGIWRRSLTDCEISKLYASGVSPVSATSNSSLICVGQSATMTATGANTYTWNPGNLNGSTVVVSPTVTTTYTITGTNSVTTCNSNTVFTQNVSACTGIYESAINENISLEVFPNPSNGSFEIKSASGINLTIVNFLGQKVQEIKLSSINNYSENIKIEESGIYFLLINGNSRGLAKKIIVSK